MMNSRHLSVGSTRLMTNNKKQNNNNTLNKLRERLIALELNRAIDKKKKRNGGKARPRNSRGSRRPAGYPTGLSRCAATYLQACTDPRSVINRNDVCIPKFPAMDSQKVRATSRFNFTIGTAGIGFVAAAPCLTNDGVCLWYTDATYTGTNINIYDGTGTLVTGVNTAVLTSNPYPNSTMILGSADTVRPPRGRMVSASMMCTYDGDRQTCGGSYYGYTSPMHQSVEGLTAATIGSASTGIVKKVVPGNSGQEVIAFGIDSDETDYPRPGDTSAGTSYGTFCYPFSTGASNFASGAGSTTGIPIMCCLISSKAANVFFCDYVQFAEFVGSGVLNTSPTIPDARGFEIASAALNMVDELQCANPNTPLRNIAAKAANFVYEHQQPIMDVAYNAMAGRNRPVEFLGRQQVIMNGGRRAR